MEVSDELLVRVHVSWNGWQHADVQLGRIRDVHWSQPEHAPHQLLFGVVSCGDIVSSSIPHECDQASAPHDVPVCVLKRHVISSVYAALVEAASRSHRRQLKGDVAVVDLGLVS